MEITKEQAEEIYTILVEECGARNREADRIDFTRQLSAPFMSVVASERFFEYRFSGSLGFGGKCRSNNNKGGMPYVDYYPEDRSGDTRQDGRARKRTHRGAVRDEG